MFNIKKPIYDPAAVQPMRDELVYAGFEELLTAEDVREILSGKNDETVLVFINSVCGCAASSARPGVTLALQAKIIPDRLTTVFAGQDREAVDLLRNEFLGEFPPSSPSIALFNNGEVLFMMHRFEIEGRNPETIAMKLQEIFEKNCKRQGPSISHEAYEKLIQAVSCGSKIPLNS